MNKLTGVTALIGGILLLVVPRFILPACEYQGYAAMHCSHTARWEMAVGTLLIATGVPALVLKSRIGLIMCSLAALSLFIISFVLPDVSGYCRSVRMPCNYGMVPGIRFIAAVGGTAAIAAVISIFTQYGRNRT